MKKSRLNKVSKQPISKIQREIWKLVKPIVIKLYGNNCYTCPAKNLVGANCQLGHVPWPKSTLGAYLKYDLRCLRIQCFACNIHRGGMGAEAYKRMLKEEGKAYMDKLEKDRQITVKAYDHFIHLLDYYTSL